MTKRPFRKFNAFVLNNLASSRKKISHLIYYWIVHNTNCWNFSNCKTNRDTNKGEPTDSIIYSPSIYKYEYP